MYYLLSETLPIYMFDPSQTKYINELTENEIDYIFESTSLIGSRDKVVNKSLGLTLHYPRTT